MLNIDNKIFSLPKSCYANKPLC